MVPSCDILKLMDVGNDHKKEEGLQSILLKTMKVAYTDRNVQLSKHRFFSEPTNLQFET